MAGVAALLQRSVSSTGPPGLPARAALFLDFDGTLAPIAPRPQDVQVPDWVVPTLARLQHGLQGALAIVSGRALTQIDALLRPLVLQVAGSHGAERRDALGAVQAHHAEPPAQLLMGARELASRHEDLIVEIKPSGFALHFRLCPELESTCHETLARLLAHVPGAALDWELLHGHCVVEVKQRAVSKGGALRAYLADPLFAARIPAYLGDDCTDESAMQVAQAAGGFGVRVGPGCTQARYRLADTHAVAAWLQAAARSACDSHATGAHA